MAHNMDTVWKYNKEKHQVDEQPTGTMAHELYKDNDGWEKYLKSLRHIPVSGDVDWKDGEDETGKFKIVTAQKKRGTEEFSIAIPIKQGQRQQPERFEYLKSEADLQLIKMKALGIDTKNQFFEQMVNHAIYMAGGLRPEPYGYFLYKSSWDSPMHITTAEEYREWKQKILPLPIPVYEQYEKGLNQSQEQPQQDKEQEKCTHKWVTVCSKCGKDKPINF